MKSRKAWALPPKDKRKYEAAEALMLLPRLKESGWAGLTAQEAGRIGARVRREHPHVTP